MADFTRDYDDDVDLDFNQSFEGDCFPVASPFSGGAKVYTKTKGDPIGKSNFERSPQKFRHYDMSDSEGRETSTRSMKQRSYYDSEDSGISSGFTKSTVSDSGLSEISSQSIKGSIESQDVNSSEKALVSQFSDLKLSQLTKVTHSNQTDEGISSVGFSTSSEERRTQTQDDLKLSNEALEINQDGDMPLHLAIIFLKIDIALILTQLLPVKFLDHANNLLQTPLHLSVLTRQPRVTRALILAGASCETPDRHGNTALHLACIHKYLDCVGALTQPVSLKELTDFMGRNRQFRIPQLPQNLELKNYEGYTCLHLATLAANYDLLMYLFQRGANINCADDKSGRRPLHYAVEMGNKELVEFLIKRLGADVNATTFDLNTPLHLAAGRDNSTIVHLLLACGASRHACNSEGHSPYEVAKSDKLIGLLRTVEYSDFKITGI